MSSKQSGVYYCTAKNEIGLSRSLDVQINMKYSPRSTSASLSPSGDVKEGDSVILTCSSDANPPAHSYTWYKKTGDQSSRVGSSQNNSFAKISSQYSGLYYCVAENEIGQNSSSAVQINVKYSPRNTLEWQIPHSWTPLIGVVIGCLLVGLAAGALIGVVVYKRVTQTGNVRDTSTGPVGGTTVGSQSAEQDSSGGIYTALQPGFTPSEYDTLAAVQPNPGDDTYTGLNLTTRSPDYDTLDNVKVSADIVTYTTTTPVPFEASDYDN